MNIQVHNIRIFYTALFACALAVLVPSNVFAVEPTPGHYNDTETSAGNSFGASFFDVAVTNREIESFIGPQAESDFEHRSSVFEETGSLEAQYEVSVHVATSTSDAEFCNALMLTAYRAGTPTHFGAFPALSTSFSSVLGETWEFQFDLPPGAPVGHGEECNAEIVFDAWREDTTKEESGYSDVEKITVALTARMVVLNEIYPNPNPEWSYPNNTEWIEIQNTGNTVVDIAGWQISELSGGTEKFYDIVASTTSTGQVATLSGSTLIAPGGFAVVLFDGSKLNNTGDTVRLYEKMFDDTYRLLDRHNFGVTDKGKSHARIESGTGDWVDPFPTPGLPNSLEEILMFEIVTVPSDEGVTDTVQTSTTSTIAGEVSSTSETQTTAGDTTVTATTSTSTIKNSAQVTEPATREENSSATTTQPAKEEDPVVVDGEGQDPPIEEPAGDEMVTDTGTTTLETIDEQETASSTQENTEVDAATITQESTQTEASTSTSTEGTDTQVETAADEGTTSTQDTEPETTPTEEATEEKSPMQQPASDESTADKEEVLKEPEETTDEAVTETDSVATETNA